VFDKNEASRGTILSSPPHCCQTTLLADDYQRLVITAELPALLVAGCSRVARIILILVCTNHELSFESPTIFLPDQRN
jgi:hypothetical protein